MHLIDAVGENGASFFRELGLELEGQTTLEGECAGRVTGLGDQRVEIAMMRTPDGHGRLELSRFHRCGSPKRADQKGFSLDSPKNSAERRHRSPVGLHG